MIKRTPTVGYCQNIDCDDPLNNGLVVVSFISFSSFYEAFSVFFKVEHDLLEILLNNTITDGGSTAPLYC